MTLYTQWIAALNDGRTMEEKREIIKNNVKSWIGE